MNIETLAVSIVAGLVTTWIAGKIVSELRLPGYVAPVVGSAVGVVVNNAVKHLR